MTWVKLCGLRSREDVSAAVEVGADAVGFVISPASPRCVGVESIPGFCAGTDLPRYVVSVDLEPSELLAAAATAEVTGVQPHGRHAAAAAGAALHTGYEVLFPVPVADAVDLDGVPGGAVPLLDTAVPGSHGGTGRSFNWELAAGLEREVVLAGGLTPDNVAGAIAVAEPWGVDVSSGIERAPGKKDHELMRRFVEAVR